jgi:hypothetical protein
MLKEDYHECRYYSFLDLIKRQVELRLQWFIGTFLFYIHLLALVIIFTFIGRCPIEVFIMQMYDNSNRYL